jgi:hypothetical protein
MPDRPEDPRAPSAPPERFDNNRSDPRARPTHQEPSPKPEPKPNQEYSRNDYSEGNDDVDKAPSGCTGTDENGNCYRDGCPVHDAK